MRLRSERGAVSGAAAPLSSAGCAARAWFRRYVSFIASHHEVFPKGICAAGERERERRRWLWGAKRGEAAAAGRPSTVSAAGTRTVRGLSADSHFSGEGEGGKGPPGGDWRRPAPRVAQVGWRPARPRGAPAAPRCRSARSCSISRVSASGSGGGFPTRRTPTAGGPRTGSCGVVRAGEKVGGARERSRGAGREGRGGGSRQAALAPERALSPPPAALPAAARSPRRHLRRHWGGVLCREDWVSPPGKGAIRCLGGGARASSRSR